MRLEKELFLDELKIQRVSNAPCEFTAILGGEKSRIVVSRDTAEYLLDGMNPLDVPGKDLGIILYSEEIEMPEGEFVPFNIPDGDSLSIKGVYKSRDREWQYLSCPPSQMERTNYSIHLHTPGQGLRFSPIPCPYLDLNLFLTEAEYKKASQLSSTTIFRWDLKPIK